MRILLIGFVVMVVLMSAMACFVNRFNFDHECQNVAIAFAAAPGIAIVVFAFTELGDICHSAADVWWYLAAIVVFVIWGFIFVKTVYDAAHTVNAKD